MPELNSYEIMDSDEIAYANNLLAPFGLEIIEGEEIDPYTTYLIHKDGQEVFQSIYGKELIVKLAQLIPSSEVRLGRYDFSVDDKPNGIEILKLTF